MCIRDRSRTLSFVAGTFLGIDLVLWTHAIYDVGAGIATVLGNLQVVFVTFIAWVWLRERPRFKFLLALPVVLLGVVFLAGLAGHSGPNFHPVAGVLYGLGTSLTYAAFILILRASTKAVSYTHLDVYKRQSQTLSTRVFGASAISRPPRRS